MSPMRQDQDKLHRRDITAHNIPLVCIVYDEADTEQTKKRQDIFHSSIFSINGNLFKSFTRALSIAHTPAMPICCSLDYNVLMC